MPLQLKYLYIIKGDICKRFNYYNPKFNVQKKEKERKMEHVPTQ